MRLQCPRENFGVEHPALISKGVLDWWNALDRPRDLPWRSTRDPWAILVSETMSQQTQIERIVAPYLEFLDRFPNPQAAADAGAGALVDSWSGLGYNRRAVMLHRAAVQIVDKHDGSVPADLEGLLALPGVGPYTARAVLAFAFERDVAVLDTNVGRVLARTIGRALHRSEAQELADQLTPSGTGWSWNQAVLDFGATVCRKRNPTCDVCPIVDFCDWGGVGADPAAGSAGVSTRQSTFEGSDRQGRGRIIAALRGGPVELAELDAITGWEAGSDRLERIVRQLIKDGLAVASGQTLRLPT